MASDSDWAGSIGGTQYGLHIGTLTKGADNYAIWVQNNKSHFGNVIDLGAKTFAALPAAPVAGMIAHISNSTVNTWGATVAGGGANAVLAWYNGTNWTVIGA